MNKLRPIQEIFYAIMRLTFTQMLIMVALTSLTSAAHLNTNAQEILKRNVSLSVKDQELREVLSEIEKQTSVVFTYQSKIIQPSRKISLEVKNTALGDVLTMLFDSSISMVAIDDEEEIVLKSSNAEITDAVADTEVITNVALTV